MRIAKAERELMPVAQFDQAIEELAGAVLVAISAIPARLYPSAQDL